LGDLVKACWGSLLEIRIRREGYSNQEDHRSFYQQFHILLSMEDTKNGKCIDHLAQVLSKRLSLSEAEWQIGHSKISLRSELASKLEVLAKLQ
jgi:myosin heavy subunit